MSRRQVHKFGGSSLADRHCFTRVCELIQEHTHGGDLVVVSAAGKTTNHLLALLESQLAEEREAKLQALLSFQQGLIQELLSGGVAQTLIQALQADIQYLREKTQQALSVHQLADCVGYGEVWSARLLAALLNQEGSKAQWLDARTIFVAGEGPQPEIEITASKSKLKPILEQFADARLIVTGFIARNPQGLSVTLGRNGSDYSASMLAVLAEAKQVAIWTDVAGVYSADPRKVDGARALPLLAMQEANELARLGSPVLHARTLQPLLGTHIRASVRSTFSADGKHTEMISGQAGDKGAKTVNYLERVSLIRLDVPRGGESAELLEQIEAFLTKHQLMPLAQQVSRDQKSISLCFTEELADTAFSLLKDYQHGGHISLDDQFCLLALVGAGVRDNARHYHSFYRCLDQAPVEFVETGPEGVSLVAVLRHTQLDELVAQLHQVIASPDKRVGIVLFGAGKIGRAWLNLFLQEKAHLANHHNMAVNLIGIASLEHALVDFAGLSDEACRDFPAQGEAYETSALFKLLATHPYDELVLVDATGSVAMAEQYPQLFAAGCHIVSANKEPASAALSVYEEITQHQQERARHWFYGATIAACLPITESAEALQNAGDQVESVEGVLSGSWSQLLAQYDGQSSFTACLQQAWEQGLTEPDPREDLSGQDLVRKLLILSRKLGIELEPSQIQCQSLLPPGWEGMSLEACWEDAQALDTQMAAHYAAATAKGERLCYQAKLHRTGKASIELISVPNEHTFGHVPQAVTSAAIRSRWYPDLPMLLQGPGGGPTLAAGAIQMDLFRLCRLIRQV